MGFQVTILLADVVYLDIIRSVVPIYDSYSQTPLLLIFFGASITLLCICLLFSTHTLFLYHVSEYEAVNFSASEAKVGRALANVSFQLYRLWVTRQVTVIEASLSE